MKKNMKTTSEKQSAFSAWYLKTKKKKKKKTYLLVYSVNDMGIIVERWTKKQMNARINDLELDDYEFAVIDGDIIK
jgi:hypothetical protein